MERYLVNSSGPIYLGRAGEKQAREIAFDFGQWKTTYGPGTVHLTARRPCETTVYPVPLKVEGNLAIWEISKADTAVAGCSGECELSYDADSGALVKSATWSTYIQPSIDGEVTDPPEAAEPWLDALHKAEAATEENARVAGEFAAEAEEWAKKAAAGGGGSVDSLTADKVTFSDGETFQQKYDSGELRGREGDPGYTPVKNVDYFDGKDGITPHIGENDNWRIGDTDTGVKAKGEDGNGIASIVQTGGTGAPGTVDTHTITMTNGKTYDFNVYNGADGKDGKDGADGTGGSGGSPNVYSTEEIVVGTWIDGKPIYRKCKPFGVIDIAAGAAANVAYEADFSNDIDHKVTLLAKADYTLSNSKRFETLPSSKVSLRFVGTGVNIYNTDGAITNLSGVVIFEYTKTTDTATIAIPTVAALMAAYEEGVQNA